MTDNTITPPENQTTPPEKPHNPLAGMSLRNIANLGGGKGFQQKPGKPNPGGGVRNAPRRQSRTRTGK